MDVYEPLRTPSPSRFKTKGLVDSPFSDYYTDTSPAFSPSAKFTSPFQQKLLTRLNRIGTQVLRRSLTDDASKDIEIGLDALENRIQAPEVKSKESADVADSGLFIDDEDEEDVYDSQDSISEGSQEDLTRSRDGLGMRMSNSPEEEYLDSPLGSVKSFLVNKVVMDTEEADALVKRVTNIAGELRSRYEEVRHLNDQMVSRVETASNEVLHLRSENEALRADLSFDHSELLFLKLQLKAVQLSIEPQLPADGQYTSSVTKSLSDGLERWKKDWKDVDLKFQARRAKYGIGEFPNSLDATPGASKDAPPPLVESKQTPALEDLRSPPKIIAIRRPMAPRSFTTPPTRQIPPLPAEPPTPSLTSGSESDDDLAVELEADDMEETALDRSPTTDSVAITTSDEMDDDDEESEFDDSVKSDSDDDDEPRTARSATSKPYKTPWQELWDGLSEFAGMRTDDD